MLLSTLKINNSLSSLRLIIININFFSSYVTKWIVEKSVTENTVKNIFWIPAIPITDMHPMTFNVISNFWFSILIYVDDSKNFATKYAKFVCERDHEDFSFIPTARLT